MNRRTFLAQLSLASSVAQDLTLLPVAATTDLNRLYPAPAQPIQVGSQRQLFFDDFFLSRQSGIRFSLHPPANAEVALHLERPSESKSMHYPSVIKEGGVYRMWYRVEEGKLDVDADTDRTWLCYAESPDGIRWTRPNLGIISRQGSKSNNLVWPQEGMQKVQGDATSIILDPNSSVPSRERYKMITRAQAGICGYVSADGLHWESVASNPLLTQAPFDSQNVLLWDDDKQRYVIYCRGVDKSLAGPFLGGRRAVRRSESPDFRQWSVPELVLGPDKLDPVNLHIYTNAAVKYSRAAHAYLMFPMVLYVGRHFPGQPNVGGQTGGGLSNVIFATSRDGIHWNRAHRQPFLAPGLDERDWVDRNPIMGIGVVPTGTQELSMYHSELYRSAQSGIRRCTVRTDGFVSIEGPYTGWGEFTTHPLIFSGSRLELNCQTSGGGSIFVEIQTDAGETITGYGWEDCNEIFGDKIEMVVGWKNGADVSGLAGKPVRLRVKLRDAHLYAFQFAPHLRLPP